jgi:hypothetical protein
LYVIADLGSAMHDVTIKNNTCTAIVTGTGTVYVQGGGMAVETGWGSMKYSGIECTGNTLRVLRTSSSGSGHVYGGGAFIVDFSNERGSLVDSNFSSNRLIAHSVSAGNTIQFRGGGLQLMGHVEMNNTRFVGNLASLTGIWASTTEAIGGGCSVAAGAFLGTNLQFLHNRLLSSVMALGGGFGMSRNTYWNTATSAAIDSATAVGNVARGVRVSDRESFSCLY